jgi:MFS family permease
VTRLRGTYALAVAVVLLGLCPDLVLSTSFVPLSPLLMKDLGTSLTGLQVANGLSNAAFAIGAVVAAQLLQRYMQRPLFTAYVATFVIGSICAAIAPSLPLFLVGRLMQGGTTGLMMISSLPPLVTRFGVRRLTWTVALVDVGLFGATTLGPVVGGFVADSGSWRVLMWVVAAVGAAAGVAAVLGYPAFEPVDPSLPVDRPALVLTAVGPTLLFLATSVVSATSWTWLFWVPFVAGLATIVALIAHERRREDPLMPVEELATQLPVTGTLVAMVAGAASAAAEGRREKTRKNSAGSVRQGRFVPRFCRRPALRPSQGRFV